MNDLFEICNLEENGCDPVNVIFPHLCEKTEEISSMLSRLRDRIPRTRGTIADNYITVSAKRTILLDAPTYTRLRTSRKRCLVKLNYTSFFSTSQKTKEKNFSCWFNQIFLERISLFFSSLLHSLRSVNQR